MPEIKLDPRFIMGGLYGYMSHPPIPGPLKIFRKGRFIGTVPAFPVVSQSGIFDVRPTDFIPTFADKPEDFDAPIDLGETYLEAAWNIGPGDFRCLAGFVPAGAHEPEPMGEAAELYNKLAAEERKRGA